MRVHSRARTRMCVSGGCGGREGPGGVGGCSLCARARACVCVCVHGHYLDGLMVGGDRERVKFVSIVM